MTNREMEDQLRKALHHTGAPVSSAHRKETQALMEAALSKHHAPARMSSWGFLGTQVRFIGWKIWLFQALTLLILTGVIFSLRRFFPDNPHLVGVLMSGCSFLIFGTAIPFLYRSRRYQMSEVEMVTRFSGVRQLGAKLLIIGIGDFSMLCSLFCVALVKTGLPPEILGLYLLLPFLSSASSLLYLIGHTPVSKLAQNSVVVCAGLFLGFTLLTRLISTSQDLIRIGAIVCILLLFVCGFETHTIFYHSPYEEIQLL